MQPLLASEPTHVGDYQFLARLGRGSMGGVYLAHSRGGRVVAVKLVRADLADDAEFRERFRREVDMARSVGGFWTAAVVDADPDAEQPWLATEYVPGPTLHRAVADHGPLPEQTVRSLAAGLAEALGAIHRAGLVHRDLKPANVLLGPDGPRVIDFGISRAAKASTLTATGAFLGTPGFFSPEQTLGSDVGPASDVFSLASVLVFAASGNGPFGNENTAAMLYRAAHSEADLSGVPEQLRPLLAACLAKDPAQRPTTTELLDQVGGSSPQGNQWLPSEISAAISEHTTQLQQTTAAAQAVGPPSAPSTPEARPAPPAQQPQSPLPAQNGQDTRSYTSVQPPAPSPPREPPVPSDVERTNEITPARPKGTQQQPSARSPMVRKDEPGPVFRTGGRASAFTWALFVGSLVAGAIFLIMRYPVPDTSTRPLEIGLNLLIVGCGLFLLKALTPRLQLKINSDGFRLSRAGLSQEVAWSQVRRVGLVGRGSKQSVTVWCRDEAQNPRTKLWHPTRKYHGGVMVFPIGATGGFIRRRKETRRVRLALEQYARHRYDNRLL